MRVELNGHGKISSVRTAAICPLHGQLDRIAHTHGPQTGVALLEGAMATIECRTTAVHPAGDHSIVVGEVLGVVTAEPPGDALLYYRGRYETLA